MLVERTDRGRDRGARHDARTGGIGAAGWLSLDKVGERMALLQTAMALSSSASGDDATWRSACAARGDHQGAVPWR